MARAWHCLAPRADARPPDLGAQIAGNPQLGARVARVLELYCREGGGPHLRPTIPRLLEIDRRVLSLLELDEAEPHLHRATREGSHREGTVREQGSVLELRDVP